jgi:hypothetical protein
VLTPLTSEAFLSTYSDGLTHFFGTLTILENDEISDQLLFGSDAQTIVTLDFMTFTYEALRQLSETEYVKITGNPGSSLTNESPTTSEAYQEALASMTFVDFAALTTTMLSEDSNNPGSYVLNPADYETILNLPTTEGEDINLVRFKFSLVSVLVMVIKLAAINTFLTKGKLKSSSANGEYPFVSFLFENSTESPVARRYLFATNFIVVGLGVISV